MLTSEREGGQDGDRQGTAGTQVSEWAAAGLPPAWRERQLILSKSRLCLQSIETSKGDRGSEEAIFRWLPAERQAFREGLVQAHCSFPPELLRASLPSGIDPHLLVQSERRLPQRHRGHWSLFFRAPCRGSGQCWDLGGKRGSFWNWTEMGLSIKDGDKVLLR